jgi:hypothetical protein
LLRALESRSRLPQLTNIPTSVLDLGTIDEWS